MTKNVTHLSFVLKELALFMLEFEFIDNFDPLYSVVQKQMTRTIDTEYIIMPTAVIDQTGNPYLIVGKVAIIWGLFRL